MSHYFEYDESVKSQKKYLNYNCFNISLSFVSDNGVFSKSEIDEGSDTLIKSYLEKGKKGKVLDVGSGVGIIGITISKINNCEVTMLEINDRAVELSKENILINKTNKCEAYKSNIYEKANDKYDVVISNPPIRAGKKVVFEILEKAREYLNDFGELWVVVRKNQGADSCKKKMIEVFNNCDIICRNKGFYVLKSIKEARDNG